MMRLVSKIIFPCSTCALLHVETSATDESAFFLLDFLDSVQKIAKENLNLSTENRFALHAIAACFVMLLAATINSAELLGVEDRLGTLEPGKLADIIAVSGIPVEDVSALTRVNFVMKDGVVVKSP